MRPGGGFKDFLFSPLVGSIPSRELTYHIPPFKGIFEDDFLSSPGGIC